MANHDYYGRMDEANRQPAADVGRADYHRLLDIAARDREALHERLHDAPPERKEAEREERQRAQSAHWQQILKRPAAPPSAPAGRQSTAVVVAGLAIAAVSLWAAAKSQQRAEGRRRGEGAESPMPDVTPEG